MLTDPISDMLTRIRNASAVKKADVVLPFSNLKYEIARVLVDENYLSKAEKIEENEKKPMLRLILKYRSNGKPYIKHIKRLSTPSRRMYVTKDSIPNVLNNYGTALISSSRGILSSKEARREKVGGELLLEIW